MWGVVLAVVVAAGKEYVWELVEPGNLLDSPASGIRPMVRYGAESVQVPGGFVVTHGYMFDHRTAHPTWMNDSWRFDFETGRWSPLVARNRGPSPRYKNVIFSFKHALYVHGGDDGGHTKSNTHVWGAHFNDLWKYDMGGQKWQKLTQSGSLPDPRQGHTAVVLEEGVVVVFGGMTASEESTLDSRFLTDSDELFLLDLNTNTWTQVPKQGTWPIGRRVHVAAVIGGFMVMHGGFSRDVEEKTLSDTWLLDIPTLLEGRAQ
eukprot:Hpha_TRINITY_DN35792_c0_g1::TRINITY_DN35792_c0_g1_i1::g.139844::m.139844